MYLWTSEDNFTGLILSSYEMGPGDWPQIDTFGDRYSYLLSHLHQSPDTENINTECCLNKTEIKLGCGTYIESNGLMAQQADYNSKWKSDFPNNFREWCLYFNCRIGKKNVSSLEQN